MSKPQGSPPPEEKETGRLEAFSDGIFGIAMTLLVLGLAVPTVEAANSRGPTNAALLAALAHQWPSYLTYFISFATVLVMWVHHHAVFKLVHRVDSVLLFSNGFLLLLITIVPFPTAVVAEYLRTPAANVAAAFYSGTFVLISLGFSVLRWAATRQEMLDPRAPEDCVRGLRRGYLVGPPFYILATLVAFVRPWLCLAICGGLWLFWAYMALSADDPPKPHPAP